MIACGALAADLSVIASRNRWPVVVRPLSPLLHNRPARIPTEVARLARRLRPHYRLVAVAYADCGTYGALDAVCRRLRLPRLSGADCYEAYAGVERLRRLYAEEPGTYVVTDFLVRAFRRAVLIELGLDRFPELRADYFGHYRRIVWLAQRRTPELEAAAVAAAAALRLPLTVIDVGLAGLERALGRLLGAEPPSSPQAVTLRGETHLRPTGSSAT